MDIEKGSLEILFLKIPYNKISVRQSIGGGRHDYGKVSEELYMQYAQSVFPRYSEDERQNHYLKLVQDMKQNPEGQPNVFRFIMGIAKRLLIYDGNEITCKFDEMLRWREISFQLGQDFFACAFLAAHDLEWGYQCKSFSWQPIIRSDDSRLHNILEQGLAENHFHLTGSTKVFELNWICVMNLIDGRWHDFRKIPGALQVHQADRVRSEGKQEGFYAECQRAALYRVYLFAVLKGNEGLKKVISKIMEKADSHIPMELLVGEIQDAIVLAKHVYGARVEDRYILDYAFEKDMTDCNQREYYLLAGERRFLYECYKACVSGDFGAYEKNLFYVYLSIRTHFRGELIQVNRQVGFENFSKYQDRKEIFIEGQKEYEDELVRLALNGTLKCQNIVSLEARICPKKSALKLYGAIKKNQAIVKGNSDRSKEEKKQSDEKQAKKIIYVLHFPKQKDEKFSVGLPRNHNVRMDTKRKARSIASLLEKGTEVNGQIRGIDTCSSEIHCRPEVFAQAFRYLLDLEFSCREGVHRRHDRHGWRTKLHATYHAGEDFLDIADGLRAIDETLLFCGLKRGSRIGHGLAMGINPDEYYKYKGYKLVMPKQLLLDDIAWLLSKAEETGCVIENRLKAELKERYCSLYDEIYREHVRGKFKASVAEYYQSWKLRGDNPQVYRLEEREFLKRLEQTPLLRFDRYEFNDRVSNHIRKIESCRELYFAYHYHQKVREIGDERIELKVDQRYEALICQIQDKMIQQLVHRGIGIETNPSSNYLIGTITKYEEHPILRFNSRKLKPVQPNMSLNVSINTDDQGVFDTSLENEYALMALALRKAKDKDCRPLYDIEDIYEWIDYVRKMGLEQIFS
ncbi:hypothetical protein AALA00_06870 [Lachnospiraceae bacterium 46-15]